MAAEEAGRVLEAAFRENGFHGTPPGLERLVTGFTVKADEQDGDFFTVFGILWFGNKVGQGQFRGKALPTYVYPECLKATARAMIPEELRDYPNPEDFGGVQRDISRPETGKMASG